MKPQPFSIYYEQFALAELDRSPSAHSYGSALPEIERRQQIPYISKALR